MVQRSKTFIIVSLLIIGFGILPTLCFGQASFAQLSKHKFTDGKEIGKLHHFEDHFTNNPIISEQFSRFNKARKTQRILNFSLLAITGISAAVSPAFLDNNEGTNNSTGLFFTYVGIVSIGPALLLISNPIVGRIKAKHKNNLLKEIGIISGLDFTFSFDICLTLGENGLGFSIRF